MIGRAGLSGRGRRIGAWVAIVAALGLGLGALHESLSARHETAERGAPTGTTIIVRVIGPVLL
ncbi:hypothetical protein [Sphingomonas sp. IC081]|uniref:hypothetical protein n=1 Tax=Sphingomonas sp. IC081 TaxID=304378 RepID=UPI00115B2D6E|nr:hypothetical protein [Sphingomonas sp. IC081]QDK34230.1 hypothetical protein DM450_15890 [Sphingomonas sp. IC081]